MDAKVIEAKKEEGLKVGDIVVLNYVDGAEYMILMEINGEFSLRNLNGRTYACSNKFSIDRVIYYLEHETLAESYEILSQDEYEIVIQPK